IGMLAAGAVTVALLLLTRNMPTKKRAHGGANGGMWALAIVGLIVFGCVLYFAFDLVYVRFAEHQDIERFGGRAEIIRNLAVLWRRFPLLGTGLGTHEMVFPVVDRTI